jgi:hypothetical protein
MINNYQETLDYRDIQRKLGVGGRKSIVFSLNHQGLPLALILHGRHLAIYLKQPIIRIINV